MKSVPVTFYTMSRFMALLTMSTGWSKGIAIYAVFYIAVQGLSFQKAQGAIQAQSDVKQSRESSPMVNSVTATPDELSCAAGTTGAHISKLTVGATASSLGGDLSYKWTVSEGSLSNDTTPNATLDTSTLSFEGGTPGQTKTVTATVTVTDESGKTASKSVDISVNCPPTFSRLDDVLFSKKNPDALNKCAKSILVDDVAPRVSSGDYYILLIGHRDADESGSHPSAGQARARSAAAFLKACGKVDSAHILILWADTEQASPFRPGSCTAGSHEAADLRVTAADKNRRVEVYLIPHSAMALPPAAAGLHPEHLPADLPKVSGCH